MECKVVPHTGNVGESTVSTAEGTIPALKAFPGNMPGRTLQHR